MLSATILIADRTTPMDELLQSFGWSFTIPGSIRCPVHGGGQEQHPSAKIFNAHDSIYCFACCKQYTPTEVAASMWSMDREAAALELLKKWPCSEEDRHKVLNSLTLGPSKTINDVYQSKLERHLRQFKRRIPLDLYRKWALQVDEFPHTIQDIPEEYHPIAVSTFIDKLQKECSKPNPTEVVEHAAY